MSEQAKVFLKFHEDQKSPTLELGHGEYTRKFEASAQPFECEPEEALFLKATGYFVDAIEASEEVTTKPTRKTKKETDQGQEAPASVTA